MYLYRNGSSFIICIINYSYYSTLSVVFIYNYCFRKFSLLTFILKTGLNLFSLIKLAVRHYFFVVLNSTILYHLVIGNCTILWTVHFLILFSSDERAKNKLLPRIRTLREITFFMLFVTRIVKSNFECLRLVTMN
jgi:hypothetical protein